MASVSDYFTKAAALWTGQIGGGGVSDASTQTVPLASATGLTNGQVYYATIDRTDTGGTKTPAKREVVKGLLSGSNLTNCVRGTEGTAQAHSAGAVVEILFTAAQWNDQKTGIEAEHNEDGTHSSALVTSLKASGADVTAGSSDVKIVTPKALKDAGHVLDTDGTLAANSDTKIATQKATKTYIAAQITGNYSTSKTFTNTRITKRVASTTASAAPAPDSDSYDVFELTAQNATAAFTVPSGTPTNSQGLIIRIKDSGTAQPITWSSATGGYQAGGIDLPTTTVTGKYLHLGFMYVTANSLNKWMLVASAQEA